MKRTKKVTNIGMDHQPVQHVLEFNVKGQKVYKPGIIEEYIKERNNNWLNDNPKVSEGTKQQIRDENRA